MTNKIKNDTRALRNGGVVIFPTDTVWGIGALVSSKKGVDKLYEIKKREKNKPTAVLVSDINMANQYGVMNKEAWGLAEKYWPGALTLVVKAKGNKVPMLVRGGKEKVGLRVPDNDVVLRLIKQLGEGIVAGSANFSGAKAPDSSKAIDKQLISMVDTIVEGESGGQEASVVVDVTEKPFKVLRKGSVELSI